MKLNFETEMATVQKLLEAQQLNLQIVSMFPAVALATSIATVTLRLIDSLQLAYTYNPFALQLDLQGLLHRVSRRVYKERTSFAGTTDAYRARGSRCFFVWQADELLRRKKGGLKSFGVHARELPSFRKDVSRLAAPQTHPEHLAMLLDVIYRQMR
jgi:hypothetical protein